MEQPGVDELVRVNIADGVQGEAQPPAAAEPARGGGQPAGVGSVEVDVADNVRTPGFRRPQSTLRYTPITLSQERVTRHEGDGSELCKLEDMLAQPGQQFEAQFARKAKLFVGITMQQEPLVPPGSSWDAALDRPGSVCATFHSVAENLETIYRSSDPRIGPEEAVVALVADNRRDIDRGSPGNLRHLQEMGLYSDIDALYSDGGPLARAGRLQAKDLENRKKDGQAATRKSPKFSVDGGKTVYLHLFEAEVWYKDHPRPVQFMFCLKEFRAGKLDSHLWLLELFTAHFHRMARQEVYTVLLDAGAVPGRGAVAELVACMHGDDRVAGCYGEVVADGGRCGAALLNPLVACQAFEYASMNFLDRQAQPLFGHAEELPGALSAYRWSSLDRASQRGLLPARPLDCYFEPLTRAAQMSALEANVRAAADRALGYRLVLGDGGRLAYVPAAAARVPVPGRLGPYLGQRQRWLNGSQFAVLYPLWSGLLGGCCGNPLRMLGFAVELLYVLLDSAVSWFRLGNTFLCSFILVRAMCGVGSLAIDLPGSLAGFLQFLHKDGQVPIFYRDIYMGMFACTLVLAMGSRPDTKHAGMRLLHVASAVLWGLVVAMVFCLAALIMVGRVTGNEAGHAASGLTRAVWESAALCLLSLVVGGLLSGKLLNIYRSLLWLPYVVVQPAVANLVQVFAFSNLNDLSWGTKGIDKRGDDDTRNGFRCVMLLLWLSTNSLLMAAVCANDLAKPGTPQYEYHEKVQLYYLLGLARVASILSLLRLACVGLFYVGAGALVSNKGRRLRPTNQQQVPLVDHA